MDQLRVKYLGFSPEREDGQVVSVALHEEFDVAVLRVNVAYSRVIVPFTGLRGVVYLGSPVTSIGRPVGIVDAQSKEHIRVLRGNVQAAHVYAGRGGHAYAAVELSFAAPPGLSGAPVFVDEFPLHVVGHVTENFQTSTIVESHEETVEAGSSTRVEYRSYITFGIAAHLVHCVDFLEGAIPCGSLKAF